MYADRSLLNSQHIPVHSKVSQPSMGVGALLSLVGAPQHCLLPTIKIDCLHVGPWAMRSLFPWELQWRLAPSPDDFVILHPNLVAALRRIRQIRLRPTSTLFNLFLTPPSSHNILALRTNNYHHRQFISYRVLSTRPKRQPRKAKLVNLLALCEPRGHVFRTRLRMSIKLSSYQSATATFN